MWRAKFVVRAPSPFPLRGGGGGGGRPLCCSGASSPVDESFTSKHVTPDGKVFRFATVTTKKLLQGDSALPAWEHACSLVGASPPTVAVTFVSKLTKSALAAVHELAGQFPHHSSSSSAGLPDEHSHSMYDQADKTTIANGLPDEHLHPTCNHTVEAAIPNPVPGASFPNTQYRLIPLPPFVGCVARFHEKRASPTSTIKGSTELGDDLIWLDDGDDPDDTGVGDSRNEQRDVEEDVEGGGSTTLKSDVKGEVTNSSDVKPVSANQLNMEDESTYSDWEDLIQEYDQLKLDSEVTQDPEVEDEIDFVVQGVSFKEGQKSVKESIAGFWNQFTHASPAAHSKSDNVFSNGTSQSRGIFKHQQADRAICKLLQETDNLVSRHGNQGFQEMLQNDKNNYSGTNGRLCTVQSKGLEQGSFQGVLDSKVKEDMKDSNRHTGVDDETYQLVLCVGHMPGVKAAGFYTRTTALPWLPDLANAVTVNNPHMLLFCAPGYNLSELTQRLSNMFPESCRAGASLLTIDGKDQEVSGGEQAHIFCGSKLFSIGAAGISINSSEQGVSVPLNAFSEFVRMSVGIPPGSCWNVSLDEAVCKSLFLPRNAKIDWLDTFRKAYKTSPKSVLDKLYSKLHKAYRGPPSKQPQSASNACQQMLSSDEPEKLPIISVNQVLFPGFFIPLFMENPCDRLMVKDCLEQGKPFGISTLCSEFLSDPIDCKDIIGTIANMKVNLFDKDCKSCIIAHGVRRFRVINRRLDLQPGTFGQLVGKVEFLDDLELENELDKEEVRELALRALGLCQQLFPSAAAMLSPGKASQDPIITSFAVSHILPVSAEVKRRWLGMVNTKYRLEEQITFLHT